MFTLFVSQSGAVGGGGIVVWGDRCQDLFLQEQKFIYTTVEIDE